jgi:hypothetical protein
MRGSSHYQNKGEGRMLASLKLPRRLTRPGLRLGGRDRISRPFFFAVMGLG